MIYECLAPSQKICMLRAPLTVRWLVVEKILSESAKFWLLLEERTTLNTRQPKGMKFPISLA